MKNNIKRIFCLLLALTMVFSMGMPALAEGESEGNGCTGTTECAAQEHNEGCLKAAADAEAAAKAAAEAEAKAKADAEAAAKANCTGDTGCTAESHNAGCLSQQQEPQHVHAYDAGVVTTDPSCFAEGVKTYTCANAEGCDKLTYTEAIPATGAHNYVDGVCNVVGCGAVEPKTPTCDKSLSCPLSEGHEADCLKAIQAMIDAVPDVPADFDGVNMPEALKAPSEAYMALSEENKALIDASRLLAWYSPVTTNCCTSYSEENKTHDSACTKTVATANNVGYESLEAAIAAATADSTVTLVKSTELGSTTVIDKSIELDLGGCALTTASGVTPTAFRITNGASVTVKNGSIDSSTSGAYCFILGASDAISAGNLIIEDGTYKGQTSVVSVTQGKLTIKDGHFSVEPWKNNGVDHYQYLINCIDKYYNKGASIEVTGGSFENFDPSHNAAESGGGISFVPEAYGAAVSAPGVFQITTAVVEDENGNGYPSLEDAFNSPSASSFKLLHSIELYDSAILPAGKTASLDLNGKTISASLDSKPAIRVLGKLTVSDSQGSGKIQTGTNSCYCIIVGDNNNAGEVTVTAGTFEGGTSAISVTKGIANINGGHYKINSATGGDSTYLLNCIDANYNDNKAANVIVSGGSFEGFDPNNNEAETGDNINYVADNMGSYLDENGNYAIGNAVASTGANDYASLDTALAAAKEGDTVTLLDNTGMSGSTVNKNLTLDLNGKSITTTACSNPAIRITDGKTLTVKDSLGNGKMDTSATGYCFILGASDSSSTGNLNIESGSFHAATSVASVTMGKLSISGGHFSVEPYKGSYDFLINCIDANYNKGAEIEVSGGVFEEFDPYNNKAEIGGGINFVKSGLVSAKDENNNFIIVEGPITDGTNRYSSLQDAFNRAASGSTLKLVEGIESIMLYNSAVLSDSKTLTIDLGGKSIVPQGEFYPVIRIEGNASLTMKNTQISHDDYVFVLGAKDGSSNGDLNILSGTYHGSTTVASVTKGELSICGGTFSVEPYNGSYGFTLNCIDENYGKSASIEVTGGSFYSFDPNNNAAEGAGTDFVPDTHCASPADANGYHTVANHDPSVGKDETHHWCTNCMVRTAHSGGTASCTEKAQCSVCTSAYGDEAGHTLSYSGKNNVITQSCEKCDHEATATLSFRPGANTFYTGAPIIPLTIVYSTDSSTSDAWFGEKLADSSIKYSNNTAISTASAKAKGQIEIKNSDGTVASAFAEFKIEKRSYTMTPLSRYIKGSGNSLSFATDITFGKDTVDLDTTATPLTISRSGKIIMTLSRGFVLTENTDGTLKVTLEPAVMNKLSRTGWYELSAEFMYGTATADFRVIQPLITPTTGDPANFLLWGGLLLGAVAAMGGILVILKKKGKK